MFHSAMKSKNSWLHSIGLFGVENSQPIYAIVLTTCVVSIVYMFSVRSMSRSVAYLPLNMKTTSDVVVPLPEAPNVNKTGRYVSLCRSGVSGSRRLGNQLFNFAAMLHVAKLTGRRVTMVRRHHLGWLDNVFNVRITRVDDIEREICPCHYLREVPPMIYDSDLPKLASSKNVFPGKSIIVCGFTQSWNYTFGVEAELRHYLRPHESLSTAVDTYLREIVPKRWSLDPSVVLERVVIHIRVGDFLSKYVLDGGFPIPQLPYFREAMQYVVNNVTIPNGKTSHNRTTSHRRIQFIVISESIDWCRKSLDLSSVAEGLRSPTVDVDLIYSDGKTADFHFVMLMKTDVAIITSGTYGWWGAWLSNKTTIYYSNYPTPGSRIFVNQFRQKDYYPTEWIPIGGPWFNV